MTEQSPPDLSRIGGLYVTPLGDNIFEVSNGLGSRRYPQVNGSALLGLMADMCELGEKAAHLKWTGEDLDAWMEGLKREAPLDWEVTGEETGSTESTKSLEDLGL